MTGAKDVRTVCPHCGMQTALSGEPNCECWQVSAATLTGNLAQRCARSLDERIARQAASLGMTVAELAERFALEIGDPDIRYDPDTEVLSIEHTVRLLPKENR